MDEEQYRDTYRNVNAERCVFEKALLSRQCGCSSAQRFNLADREGVGCGSPRARARCEALLGLLHENARFALGMAQIGGALPHAREIKVQVGGLRGLRAVLAGSEPEETPVEDVAGMLERAISQHGDLHSLPYAEVVKGIAAYRGRRKRS